MIILTQRFGKVLINVKIPHHLRVSSSHWLLQSWRLRQPWPIHNGFGRWGHHRNVSFGRGLKETLTDYNDNWVFPLDQRCDVNLN